MEYNRAIKDRPNFPRAFVERGLCYKAMGKRAEAVKVSPSGAGRRPLGNLMVAGRRKRREAAGAGAVTQGKQNAARAFAFLLPPFSVHPISPAHIVNSLSSS